MFTKQTFSPDRYKIWSMQSLYHNLPSFDGIGQLAGAKYASRNEVYDESERSLSLELADAYDERCGVISYVRKGSLRGGTVTLNEKLVLDGERLTDFVFLTHREPVPEESGKIALTEGCVLSYPTSLEAKIEEFTPVGLNAKRAWGNETLYRIHLSAKMTEGEFEFKIYHE